MVHALLHYKYALLFATAFANQVVLFVPVVPFLLSAGALAAHGQFQLGWAILAVAAGIAPADFVWYALGRRTGGRILTRVCRLALEPDSCVRGTKERFARHGARIFVVAKFIPGLSTVAMPLAGVLDMRARRFAAFDGAGALLWSGTYVVLGWLGTTELTGAARRVPPATAIVLALSAVAIYVAWRTVQRRAFVRRHWIARIEPAELRRKLDAHEPVLVLDLRHALDLQADPYVIPGATYIAAEDLPKRHAEIPRDREIVLYCT